METNSAYTGPMSEHAVEASRFDPIEKYVTVAYLYRVLANADRQSDENLGWSRPNVYYWLNRCKIRLVDIAGHKYVPMVDLPMLIMTLQAAKREAREKRSGGDG